MTACVRGNARKCTIDYTPAGGTSPDTFEVGAATGIAHLKKSCFIERLNTHSSNKPGFFGPVGFDIGQKHVQKMPILSSNFWDILKVITKEY